MKADIARAIADFPEEYKAGREGKRFWGTSTSHLDPRFCAFIKGATERYQMLRVARAFCRVLRRELTTDEFPELIERNKSNPPGLTGTCASHDFCDANMAMEEAIRKVTRKRVDIDDDETITLWESAWNTAKAADFNPKTIKG